MDIAPSPSSLHMHEAMVKSGWVGRSPEVGFSSFPPLTFLTHPSWYPSFFPPSLPPTILGRMSIQLRTERERGEGGRGTPFVLSASHSERRSGKVDWRRERGQWTRLDWPPTRSRHSVSRSLRPPCDSIGRLIAFNGTAPASATVRGFSPVISVRF